MFQNKKFHSMKVTVKRRQTDRQTDYTQWTDKQFLTLCTFNPQLYMWLQ